MTNEELIRKIYYYAEDEIYDCDVGIRVCEPSDISEGRHRTGGRWMIMERAQHIKDANELKNAIISWKEKFDAELYNYNHDGSKNKLTMVERNNERAELRGKIFACIDLLKKIEELESK